MPKTFSRGQKLVFSMIILVAALLVLEITASLYLRLTAGYDGDHLLRHSYDPYKNVIPTKGYVDTRGVTHNSVGFRGNREYSVKKPADTYRVVLMGASTAYGLGTMWPWLEYNYPVLKDSETLGPLLEEVLSSAAPRGVRVEVINAAIASHWTHHHLIYLNQGILKYQPDFIVFVDGFNDYFFFESRHDQFSSYPEQGHANEIMADPTLKSLAYANAWWLFRRSALAHNIGRAARKLSYFFGGSERKPLNLDAVQAAHRKVFEANALKMNQRIAAMLKAEGVRSLFVLQPMLILERNRRGMTDHERALFDFNVSSYLPNYEQFMLKAVPFVNERMKDTVAHWGAEYVDATGVFNGVNEQVYTDYCHLTPTGNRVLAEFIASPIRRHLSDVTATTPR